MVKEYPLTIGGHKFVKKNLVTKYNSRGTFDEYECERCGLKARSYKLGFLELDQRQRSKFYKCPNMQVKKRLRIRQVNAHGEQFIFLTPGSEHDIIAPPLGQNSSRGEWVQGVGEPVLVLFEEFDYID